MNERFGRRRPDLGLAFGAALVVLAAAACTEAKKDAPATPDASTLAAGASSLSPAEVAPALDAGRAVEPETEAVVDAGADAGPRKLRRLVAKSDAGAGPEVAVAAPSPPEAAPADPRKGKRVAGAPMSDESPYGNSTAGSGTPSLKKAPLPNDDPWAKAPAPTPPH